MQVVGARMGYEPKDSGWHNLAFIGTISRRRLQSDARILWLDWEDNCRSAPYPSRKSLNDVVKIWLVASAVSYQGALGALI